jgi:tRNA (cytidine32/uridine32-2'-O)-methyltransferase
MKNMGLGQLVLVDAPALAETRVATLAVHASDVLAARHEVATLAEALAGCSLVVGTSGRPTAAWSHARSHPPSSPLPRATT